MKKIVSIFIVSLTLAGFLLAQEPRRIVSLKRPSVELVSTLSQSMEKEDSSAVASEFILPERYHKQLYPTTIRSELKGMMERETPLGILFFGTGVFAIMVLLIVVCVFLVKAMYFAFMDCMEACKKRRSEKNGKVQTD